MAPDRSAAYDLDFLSSAGSSSGQSAANVTIADGNSSAPINGSLSGTYEATDLSTTADSFTASTSPAPSVPGTINYSQPDYFGGTSRTFASAFGGANGTGDWALFAYNGTGTPINITGGWCLSFEVNNGLPTTTTLTSTSDMAYTGTPVTLTATVTSGGNPVSAGTVTILDNSTGTTLASGVTLNGSGQVAVTTSSLAEGDHAITATYSGVTNTYDPSSGSLNQREDNITTITGNATASSPALLCNTGGLTLPSTAESANNHGPASPNPSNIFATNLPGTLNSVEVQFGGFFNGSDPTIVDTASLLVGPNGTGFDFFSGTGNNTTVLSTGNYNFADGNGTVPQSPFGPGTYEATAYDTTDSFVASPFYTLPGSFDYAQPHSNPFTFNGSSDGAFTSIDPNGVWSLYFYQNIHDVGAGAAKWCLSIIDNLPSVTASAGHSGTFVQGATSQPITLNITNNGTGSTGDPGGSNPLTVVDTLPTGLSLASSSGTGWSCTGTATVTCTNDSAVAQSASYPQLTLNVNVADSTVPGNVNNAFSVSGGGANSTTSNTDVINIEPAAVLAIQVTHTGTFTQGSTAEWDITVSNTASGGSTMGTTTVSDTLPSGYTLNASSGIGWTCGGVGTVTCTSTSSVSGGSSFQTIQLIVNVPTTSPISVTNTASAFGGGDLIHTNLGTAVSGSDTVTVVQVPLVTLSATSLSYGSVDVGSTSSSQSVIMSNTGSATLTISSIAVTGANASSFVFANTCGTSLAVGANCTIHGHFAPTATGALTAAVTIADNASSSPQTIALSGTGVTPQVTLSSASLSFGSVNVGSTSGSQSVTMTNTGTGPLTISSVAVTGANASQFVFANSCRTSLAVGANCTIHGHFAPTATGALTAAVTIADNASSSPQTIALSGTGLGPQVTLSATSLSYGSVNVGSTNGSQSVTMTNTGTGPLTISSVAVTGANASQFVFANNCGTSLAVGANCTIHGHFAPTATGALTAAVTITDNAGSSPQTIALSGTGLGPQVTLSSTSLSFGSVNVGSTSGSQSVTMTNSGTATLTISSIAVTGVNASQFVFANSCGSSLAAGANCTIHGHFAPTTTGLLNAAITITDGAPNSPQTITLDGTGQ